MFVVPAHRKGRTFGQTGMVERPILEALLVGGGRWARVLARVLDDVLPPAVPLIIASPSAATAMEDWTRRNIAAVRGPAARPITVRPDLPTAALQDGLAIAVVANRPADHCATTERLIGSGYHVLVEKPFALDPAAARRVIALAAQQRKLVAVGLTLLFAPHLRDFYTRLPFSSSAVSRFEIVWWDPMEEARYGEMKRPDLSVNVAQDVLPHAWSIIKMILGIPSDRPEIGLTAVRHGGAELLLEARASGASGSIHLKRGGSRRRWLALHAGSQSATLDFTQDPGQAIFDGAEPISISERTGGGALTLELQHFIACARAAGGIEVAAKHPTIGEGMLEHVDLVCAVDKQVRERQRRLILAALSDGSLSKDPQSAYALRELLTASLSELVPAGAMYEGAYVDAMIKVLTDICPPTGNQ